MMWRNWTLGILGIWVFLIPFFIFSIPIERTLLIFTGIVIAIFGFGSIRSSKKQLAIQRQTVTKDVITQQPSIKKEDISVSSDATKKSVIYPSIKVSEKSPQVVDKRLFDVQKETPKKDDLSLSSKIQSPQIKKIPQKSITQHLADGITKISPKKKLENIIKERIRQTELKKIKQKPVATENQTKFNLNFKGLFLQKPKERDELKPKSMGDTLIRQKNKFLEDPHTEKFSSSKNTKKPLDMPWLTTKPKTIESIKPKQHDKSFLSEPKKQKELPTRQVDVEEKISLLERLSKKPKQVPKEKDGLPNLIVPKNQSDVGDDSDSKGLSSGGEIEYFK